MATYNGAAFLEEQLESVAGQTRPPLEIVVRDDGSSDATVAIAERFASAAPFDVHVIKNDRRLGHAHNFLQAARLCKGDLVAWCDQDDVWMPHKLERCLAEFERDESVRLVVHARQIGGWRRRGRPVIRGGVKGRASRASRRSRSLTPQKLPLEFSAPGYASIVDRSVLRAAQPFEEAFVSPKEGLGHDTWSALLAAAAGRVVFIPDVLAYYRQHEGNAIGAPRYETLVTRSRASAMRPVAELVKNLEREIEIASSRVMLLGRIASTSGGAAPNQRLSLEQRRVAALRSRQAQYQRGLSLAGSLADVLGTARCGHYRRRGRGGLGATALARDVLHAMSRTDGP